MKKLNKLFLGLASAAAVATPIATVVSCGSSSKLSADEMVKLQPKAVSKERTMLVTDSGSIDDKSFNQQAADALKSIKGSSTLSDKDFIKPAGHDAGTIVSAYESAVGAGATTIIAPGFYHVDAITSFVQSHKNAANFIIADGVVKAGNVASVTFDTKQPAFLAGY